MNAVTSRLLWGIGRSKTPVRAETVIGTVVFMHFLAATRPASNGKTPINVGNISVRISKMKRLLDEYTKSILEMTAVARKSRFKYS